MRRKEHYLLVTALLLSVLVLFPISGCTTPQQTSQVTASSLVPTSSPVPTTTKVDIAEYFTGGAFKSFQQASANWSVEIPWPHYLPEGYKIQRVHFVGGRLVFVISKENGIIDFNQITDENILLDIYWHRESTLPYKINTNQSMVDINGNHAQLNEGKDQDDISWEWSPERYKPGSFILRLSAFKNLTIPELIKTANSIDF
jgi:hypothetical protein